jgi:hypothetical protein
MSEALALFIALSYILRLGNSTGMRSKFRHVHLMWSINVNGSASHADRQISETLTIRVQGFSKQKEVMR